MLERLIKESDDVALMLDKMFCDTDSDNIERFGKINRLVGVSPTEEFNIKCDLVRARIYTLRQQNQAIQVDPSPNEKLAEYAAYVEDQRRKSINYLVYLDEQLVVLEEAHGRIR